MMIQKIMKGVMNDMTEKNINFDELVNRKNTDCLKYDFAVQRGKPKNVLPLWVADMDFKTSSLVLDEIQKRVEHGIFGYTETGDSYFNAVSGWLKNHHDMQIQKEWLVNTPGVVYALAMAVRAYTNEGDAILIQQPVYYPFTQVITDNGRKVISSDLILEADGKYHIDFEDFEAKVREENIKLFFLCSPHNPVGRVWTKNELEKIADICIRYNIIVVSDEIHEDFTYEGFKHIPFLNVNERVKDLCIVATSPAKTFNLAGLQASNIIIPNEKLRNAFKKQISATGYSQLNTMGIIAVEAAYNYGSEWFFSLKKYLQDNLDFLRNYIEKELPDIKLVEPEGTYLVWLDFRKLGLSEGKLEDLIVNKVGLWLDSGAMFGKSGEGFERVNIATQRAVLKEALERIKSAINQI